MEELIHVRNMPLAYEAALSEVARRRTFGRQYVAKVRKVQCVHWFVDVMQAAFVP